MPKFNKVHPVHHTATQMFDLVADVESYPQFVPMCESLTINSRQSRGDREVLVADMCIAYKALRECFTSQVVLNRTDLCIDVEYLDGPFSHLHNRWNFVDTPESDPVGSNVVFDIDYAFKSRLLGALVGGMFEMLFGRFTLAFEKRADEIYRTSDSSGPGA